MPNRMPARDYRPFPRFRNQSAPSRLRILQAASPGPSPSRPGAGEPGRGPLFHSIHKSIPFFRFRTGGAFSLPEGIFIRSSLRITKISIIPNFIQVKCYYSGSGRKKPAGRLFSPRPRSADPSRGTAGREAAENLRGKMPFLPKNVSPGRTNLRIANIFRRITGLFAVLYKIFKANR